ncbi:MAG TPA: BON domain-containing protein [Nitrospirales bacterium]|nr:BON domain-containing protein [Nitrospirales bacterium]
MKSPFKYFVVLVTCPLFIATIMENTEGQVLVVPLAGFEETISPETHVPRSDEDNRRGHSDEELEYRIQRRLEISPYRSDGITVQVKQGKTVLSGHVKDRDSIVDVVEIAYDSGATNVDNQIQLDHPWREINDQKLKEAVEAELYLSPFVNSVPIRVEAQSGTVTLSGRVENRGEIVDAVKNAYEAGAKNVRIRLWIDPTLD